jgi:hypothetical protein
VPHAAGSPGLGVRLLGRTNECRTPLARSPTGFPRSGERRAARALAAGATAALNAERRKLLALYYVDKISAGLFAEDEERLRAQAEGVAQDEKRQAEHVQRQGELLETFERISEVGGSLASKPCGSPPPRPNGECSSRNCSRK